MMNKINKIKNYGTASTVENTVEKNKRFHFKILKKAKNSGVRLGEIIITRNGKKYKIKTPAIAIVGTKAAVKGVRPEELKKAKTQLVLANTYHLMEKADVIKESGGLHNFMNWQGPIITDSGGFQVFSLGIAKEHKISKIGFFPGKKQKERDSKCVAKDLKITEDGVYFKKENGEKVFLSPEISMKIQEKLGSDIIFAFDECTSPLADYEYTKKSMERTHRWAARCVKAKKSDQALFGIIQGGAYEDLRNESAEFISSLPFNGIGIGGSLGDTKNDMYKILDWLKEKTPPEPPKHLLGIGDLEGIIHAVKRGIDMFDCVAPTREARNGRIYTKTGFLNIRNAKFKKDLKPLQKGCACGACENYSRAYLHHLFKENIMNGKTLASIHNIYFMNSFFEELRENIDNFEKWGKNYLKRLKKGA